MEEESDPDWVTVKEAQALTGLTRTAIMMRKARGTLELKTIHYPSLLVNRVYVRRSQLPIKQEQKDT
jgi:hypothetical protein